MPVGSPDWHLPGIQQAAALPNVWQVPDGEKGLHASGHACGPDLLNIGRQINPEILIPVHSETPGFYVEQLSGSGINVALPKLGGTVEV